MIDDPGTREALTALIYNMCLPEKWMEDVWVVISDGYEQREISGVFSDSSRAIAFLKKTYGEPYVVTWDQPMTSESQVVIVAHFDYVPQYTVQHSREFTITKWKIDS